MFAKGHQSMWSIISLLISPISYAILFTRSKESDPLKFISTESLPDSNGSNLHGCIWTFPDQISHRPVNKLQKILETNAMISRKPGNLFGPALVVKTSSPPIMTSQIPYICFHSRRGDFWFVFVKLSGCLPFTRKTRLVDSCSKWDAPNPN